MSTIKIYQAFNEALLTLTPAIDTIHEGTTYEPTADKPYQELYILPAIDRKPFINETTYESRGIFQITLRYPKSQGLGTILTRVDMIKDLLTRKSKLTKDDLTVSLLSSATVRNLGVDGDRLVFVLSYEFKALI